ncbi:MULTISPECIES: lysylphosphatidylglycerol synthase transmembrane domain-containing protein [Pseudomonadaceae]|uniref:lysylphosphatidylglycerol synthase transmembrane domain-containing protein n=1 Tax=Pseudomonadaceae TaxID=135621 RepID=UPI0010386B76|nr:MULTISPECIES: lysylphosphatidylglycerol synthase transmembrane domain-containing protein [Pseudomonadaceae]MBA1277316.1 flippase-like domain-containing protein [Stutzerimonas stutzeri]MBC8650787.1 flippase-like domain-containing protein [Pseudomonas sp. MT4]QXY91452.1 flippase-like domain-containing protein [Pseudomonas sp. MTM4]TCD20411.1 flippase-like domain-containing protein [Pseudomonas sp. IC_126]
MNRRWWLLFGALLIAALVPFLLGGSGLFERLLRFPPGLLLAMLGMIVLGWYLNAFRLRLLIGRRRLRQPRALGIVIATEFAICATPGGAGGPLTMMALLLRQGVTPAKGTATFAVEQLADLLFFSCALVGVLIYAVTHSINTYIASLLGFSAALLLGLMVLLALLGRFHRQVFLINGWLAGRLGMKAPRKRFWARKVLSFRNALLDCFRLPRAILLGVFVLTTLHWLLRYSVLYLTLQGLGSQLAWAWTFIIQLLALTAGQLSLLPGGAGSAELASAALLAPLVGKSTAAAAILVWRFVTYYFYLIVGAPLFFHLAGRPLFNRLMKKARSG